MSAALGLYPAIDLQGGRCVRLLQGDFAAETVYGDAVAIAERYAAAGAAVLHVVDLDAARTGVRANAAVVREIVAAIDIPVQLGGGLRDEDAVADAIADGVARVVVGTAAVEVPGLVARLAAVHPGALVVGLDHRRAPDARRSGREVALRGWSEASGRDLLDALDALGDAPLAGVLMTDITVDGTLAGPDLSGYALALGASAHPIIASGGVGSAADVAALAALDVNGRRLDGVVIGKALLSGALDFAEARRACVR